MNYRDFTKEIKNGDLQGVYLFNGTEELLMDNYLNLIKETYIEEEFETLNFIRINKKDDFMSIIDACETLPFFSEKKLIYIEDLDLFLKNDKDNRDKLTDYIEDIPSYVIMILKDLGSNLRKNTKLYKKINNSSKVREFSRLNIQELGNFILSFFKKRKKEISNRDLNYLVNKTRYLEYGSNITLHEIENELEKIANNSQSTLINKENIDSNYIEPLENNIFSFLDNLVIGNKEGSLRKLDELYRDGEPIGRISYMILRQYRILMKYLVLKERGYNDREIRDKLKISYYEYKKVANNSRRFNKNEIKNNLEEILKYDIQQKTSSIDEKLALELLIEKLI